METDDYWHICKNEKKNSSGDASNTKHFSGQGYDYYIFERGFEILLFPHYSLKYYESRATVTWERCDHVKLVAYNETINDDRLKLTERLW